MCAAPDVIFDTDSDNAMFLLLLIISVTHSTCGVLCTVVGGVCAAASTILAIAIAKFRS